MKALAVVPLDEPPRRGKSHAETERKGKCRKYDVIGLLQKYGFRPNCYFAFKDIVVRFFFFMPVVLPTMRNGTDRRVYRCRNVWVGSNRKWGLSGE